jgi:hypothetical protein
MGTEQEEIVCRLEDMEDTEVLFRYKKGEEKYLTNLRGDGLSVRMGLICLIKKMAEVEDVSPIVILGELVTMEFNRVKKGDEVGACPVTTFHAIPDAGESE